MMQTLSPTYRRSLLRGPVLAAGASLLLLAACNSQSGGNGNFDWDLRSRSNFNTADAVASATAQRPRPDGRGIISYPGYQVVVAHRGETVGGVAQRLGLNVNEMARLNAIQPEISLSGGEVLLLPGRVAEPMYGSAMPSAPQPVDVGSIATTALDRVPATTGPRVGAQIGGSPSASTKPATAAPIPFQTGSGAEPIRHRVVRGETAYIVARKYNVTAKALAEWNGLNANMTVREGQTLLIPPSDPTKAAAARPAAGTTTVPGQGSPTPQPPSAAKPLPKETPTRAGGGNTAAAPASPNLPTTRSGAMAMPADGSIIRAYQKKKYDGIGIGAPAGSPVRAAAAGTVAAITRNTGQVPIVVIRHPDNLLTVYANVDGISVEKGASVSRGQQIGKVQAGNPAFLHFEVRRGSDSVDPMTLLK